MSVRRGIILHCCLLLALMGCQTKPASSEQSSATSQTNSSTEQVSSQTSVSNSTNAPVAQNSSVGNANTTTAATPGALDACSLITRAEIESAQGEQVTEARSTAVSHSRFAISQCYYAVAPAVKSVSLELTQRASGQSGSTSPREFWEERFERASHEKERKGERERQGNAKRDADKGGSREESEEEEEGGSPPVRVTGVGDEAFWVGNRMVGALYVLKDDSIIRISIGGPEAESVKIEKMKTLAQLAVKRLKD